MAMKDVQNAIEKVLVHIVYFQDYIGRHETCTRYAAIDPIISALGWNLPDVAEVEVEYEVNGHRRVDYALLDNDANPAIIIEAKKWSANGFRTGDELQLSEYARGMRRGYAVLTNGAEWKVWDLSKRGAFQSKLVLELNIIENSPRRCATDLNRLLRRPLHHKR